jgi:CheY-like chemotaxis protein
MAQIERVGGAATGGSTLVNVLLVDDDEVDVMCVRRAFRQHKMGNPIFVVRDGIEALAMLRSGESDLVKSPFIVLLDLNLPRMNGLELLRQLRADSRLAGAVVFVMTTSDDEGDRVAAYQAHVAGYLLKSKMGQHYDGLTNLLEAYWSVAEPA